jgi:hypothetical protein
MKLGSSYDTGTLSPDGEANVLHRRTLAGMEKSARWTLSIDGAVSMMLQPGDRIKYKYVA